ncbi:MAG: histidine kinase [Rubrivivax sp.]|nr:histidine kinase [Pyrinomonadaceae bacterium]
MRWCFGFIIWTAVALSFALRSYLIAIYDLRANVSWKTILSGYLIDFYLWGLLSPLIFLLARRFELRRHLTVNLFIHAILSAVLSFVVVAVAAPAFWYLGYPNLTNNPTLGALFRNTVFSPFYIHMGLMNYWMTLVVAHASHYYRGLREGETKAALLATQLAQAQLQALKMQIHPHFIFNTLNSIAALLHKDVEAADRMIVQLGDFLRMTLKRSDTRTTDFAQELEFLKCYLDIERTRFQDRLLVELDVEPQALKASVPNLILQPIVENAIRHGVARQTITGCIIIRAYKKNDRLMMQVEDNGPGLTTNGNSDKSSSGGIGLSNTRARLKQFYGDDYKLEIANSKGRGVIVTLEIPATDEGRNER